MKWGAYYRQSPKTVQYRIGSRRKASIGYFTPDQWHTLCELCNNRCARCGKEEGRVKRGGQERLSPDHIKPASRGGTTYIDNIQPLCVSCNVRKSNIYTTDYRPEHVKEWARQEVIRMGVTV